MPRGADTAGALFQLTWEFPGSERVSEAPIRSELLAEEPELLPIIDSFVGRLPSMVAHLKQAWQKNEWQQLREAAHELKGTSGGLGFPQLMQVADQIEAKARAQTSSGLDTLIAEFDALCARVSGHHN